MRDGEKEGPEQREEYPVALLYRHINTWQGTLFQGHLKEEQVSG